MPSKSVGINVVVRFRPCPDGREHLRDKANFNIMEAKSCNLKSNRTGRDVLFHLDTVLSDATSQENMFEAVGEPITRDVLHGYNGTIFVYGQTGSGKTHSLFGDMSNREAPQRGLIPRSCHRIFEHFESSTEIEKVIIQCSFVEIYKEKLQDLLDPKNNKLLKIRHRVDNTVYVQGLHEEFVSCFDDVYDLMQIGFRNRVVASTKMNSESSRSHCVLILRIQQTMKEGTTKVSTINFADLAGSEKVKKTGVSAEQLKQAQSINQSLSALGNVIHSLTDSNSESHVPYRDSQLTHLLKDSLMGNTKTTLVVTASSDVYNIEETITTLRFATRAKKVVNKVTVNKQQSVGQLKLMIQVLKDKLAGAEAINQQMKECLESVQSGKVEKEMSDEIGKVLALAADKMVKAKPKKQPKISLQPQAEDEVDANRRQSLRSNSSFEAAEAIKAANWDLMERVEKLEEALDTKDELIDDRNNEISALNKRLSLLRMKQSAQSLMSRIRDSKADKSNADSIEANDDTGGTDKSPKKSINQKSKPLKTNKIIKKHEATIATLKAENEQLKQDRKRLAEWNEELMEKDTMSELSGGGGPRSSVLVRSTVQRQARGTVILNPNTTASSVLAMGLPSSLGLGLPRSSSLGLQPRVSDLFDQPLSFGPDGAIGPDGPIEMTTINGKQRRIIQLAEVPLIVWAAIGLLIGVCLQLYSRI